MLNLMAMATFPPFAVFFTPKLIFHRMSLFMEGDGMVTDIIVQLVQSRYCPCQYYGVHSVLFLQLCPEDGHVLIDLFTDVED